MMNARSDKILMTFDVELWPLRTSFIF